MCYRYSCKSVRLVVEHLYKPKCDIGPDNDLIELVVLADMLGLDSLTSVVCDTVTTRLCHSFHKVVFLLDYLCSFFFKERKK